MKSELFIFYLIAFILTWICFIFWFEKDEFNFEFGEVGHVTGLVTQTKVDDIIEELYDGKKTITHTVKYVEYKYYVNGKNYQSGDANNWNDFSISDTIDIEYLKDEPSISRIKGIHRYSHNFFIRKLVPVIALSIFVMMGLIGIKNLWRQILR